MTNIVPRIKRIQKKLGVVDDGIIGSTTLTALERALGIEMVIPAGVSTLAPRPTPDALHSMTPSKRALDLIIVSEVSSEQTYKRRYAKPTWPKGASGVTIGIGFDVGHASRAQVEQAWRGRLADAFVEDLLGVVGVIGLPAKAAAEKLAEYKLTVPWDTAKAVFYESTIPTYAARTLKAYPGVEKLPPDAQGAILSLVYNRGTRKSGSTRREMAALESAIAARDLAAIAQLIRDMKRLWVGKGLDGLLKRRDAEADLVAGADRAYVPRDYILA